MRPWTCRRPQCRYCRRPSAQWERLSLRAATPRRCWVHGPEMPRPNGVNECTLRQHARVIGHTLGGSSRCNRRILVVTFIGHLLVLAAWGGCVRQEVRRAALAPWRKRAVLHRATFRLHDPNVHADGAQEADHAKHMASVLQREKSGAKNHEERTEPIDHSARAQRSATDFHGVDLGEVKPCDGPQAKAEGHYEDREADHGRNPAAPRGQEAIVALVGQHGEECHGDGLATGASQQELPAPPVIHKS
mmetsp:Transcript_57199/g.112620  ORF Transcript_57199/g.112620 Transcript_57199/m.112620 type:complete len:247 (+) Transcript_57199:54-794(+)